MHLHRFLHVVVFPSLKVRNRSALVLKIMNKVAIVSSLAAVSAVEPSSRHSSVVLWFFCDWVVQDLAFAHKVVRVHRVHHHVGIVHRHVPRHYCVVVGDWS